VRNIQRTGFIVRVPVANALSNGAVKTVQIRTCLVSLSGCHINMDILDVGLQARDSLRIFGLLGTDD